MMTSDGANLEAHPPDALALVRAVRAWGDDPDGASGSETRLLRWFTPGRRAALIAASGASGRPTPEAAWQVLLRDQMATARFDPARVHPSWFVRLFEAESPAVQAIIAEHSAAPIRDLLRLRAAARLRALDPTDGLLRSTGPAHPEAVALVLTFWTERLVGDAADSPLDPPVIRGLTRLRPRDLVALLRAAGQAKQAFGLATPGPTPSDEAEAHCRATDRVRVGYFRRIIGRADPRLAPLARADFAAMAASGPRRRYLAVGLITVARLLRAADPHRARWAVQHLPYPVARTLGALGGDRPATDLPRRALVAWERWIFEAAWARLLAEGRFGSASPSAEART